MRTLNEIIENVLDQLAPLPSGPLTPLGKPVAPQDALMAEFGIASPQRDKWPAHLPTTIEELERYRARQKLLVRLGEMVRLGEVLPRDRQTGDTVCDLGWDVQFSDCDRLVLDEADEGLFRSCYLALQTASSDSPDVAMVPTEHSSPAQNEKQSRTDNLKRAIFDAWEKGLSVDAKSSDVFDYLANKDDTGIIRGRDGDELAWENTSGQISRTTLKALGARLTDYRKSRRNPG